MGHTRLGTLPATRSWNEVIGLISEGANAARIAEATANAWRLAFAKVQGDVGVSRSDLVDDAIGGGWRGKKSRWLSQFHWIGGWEVRIRG